MKMGTLVEVGDTDRIFRDPHHEYTRHLINMMPRVENLSRSGLEIESSVAAHS